MRKLITVAVAAVLLVAGAAYLACSAQNPQRVVDRQAGSPVPASNAHPPLDQVDHSEWDRLLKKYVDRNGMVDYAAWKASETDRAALRQYLAVLSEADPKAETTKEGRLAFWINAYNALTVHGILEVYPTRSIRNHTAKVFGYNIWEDLLLRVGDKKYSLDDIEHQILRQLGEPRIHFAIVCAAIGCPRLLREAYTPAKLEAQLADNARDFFSRSKHFQVDMAGRRVRVSSIFKWFGDDFGPTPQKALARVAEYMPDEATRRLIASEDFSVAYLDYDWDLNEQ